MRPGSERHAFDWELAAEARRLRAAGIDRLSQTEAQDLIRIEAERERRALERGDEHAVDLYYDSRD